MTPGTIPLLKAVIDATWQGSLVILLVLLVRPLLGVRVPARWRSLLWMLVLVRLLVPAFVLPRSPASLQNIPVVQRPVEQAQDSFDRAYAAYVGNENARPMQPAPIQNQTGGFAGEGSAQPVVPAAPAHRPMPWWKIAALVWLSGAILCAAWIVTATLRLQMRLRRESGPVDPGVAAVWKSCCAHYLFKHPPRLVVTSLVDSPALLGVLHPMLLIPRAEAAAFSPEDWEHIFMHELAHFRRRDHWMQLVQLAALCVHWFNPLVWIGFRYLRADRELATDELALKHLAGGDRAAAYGGTLLKVLSGRTLAGLQPGLVGIVENASQIKQRLRRIVAFGPRTLFGSAIGLGLTVILAALVLGKETDSADLSGYAGMKPDATLVLAAKKGDLPVVKKMLADGVDPNSVVSIFRWEKKTPLSSAAAEGRMDVVKFLLSKGAQLNPTPDGTHSAVGFALANGWIDCAGFLVSKGANPEPIAFAAAKGDRVAIDQMLAGPRPGFDELKFLAAIAAVNGHKDVFSDLSDALASTGEYVQWDSSVAVTVIARDHRDVFDEMGRRDSSVPRGVARYAGAAARTKGMREWLIAKGCKVPEYTDNERLIDAAEYGDLPEMRRLIKAGAKVNYNGEAGWSPLAKAAAWGQPLAVKLLLENKADPDSMKNPPSGWSPLCLTDSPEIADMLLAAGADLNGRPNSMNNLTYAVSCCPDEKVKWFLDHGVDPTKVKGDDFEVTLLFAAHTPGIAEMLIAHGVDVNAKDEQGLTAMFRIEQMEPHPAAIVKVLLKHGADPNLKSKDGYTPLMAAPDGDTVDTLIAAGADPAAKDGQGHTALNSYVPNADDTRRQALERHGLKLELDDWRALLRNAIIRNNPDEVKKLISDMGPDAFAKVSRSDFTAKTADNSDFAPLYLAITWANWPIVDILRKAGADDVGLFSEAAARGDLDRMKALLAAGADVNEQCSDGETPLMFAVSCGQAKSVEFLLDHGANINIFDHHAITPYADAELLSVNIRGDWSPVAGGKMKGKEARPALDAILALFAKQKLDLNYKDKSGKTLLFVA
ncbi:MAG TPA: ankyrin repeat domain-containing protein, partial [Chthoniobacteraceae bacterium]|nr:ankyrin repeat domain-containing protein [Chthoniobacteraceae bacterium]